MDDTRTPAQRTLAHRLRQLAWFRMGLVTAFLASALAIDWVFGPPSSFEGPLGHFLLFLTGTIYVLSFAYLVALPTTRDLEPFGLSQIAGDLAFTTLVVHATGGALSGFAFLYPLATLVAALLFYDRGALLTALGGSGLFAMVSIAGYQGLIPPFPGQSVFPWETTTAEMVRLIATNTAACFAVGVLGSILANELRGARMEVEEKNLFIRDLSRLNEAIIRSLPHGLISTDSQGIIQTANQAAHGILGVPPNQLAGQALSHLAPELFGIEDPPKDSGRGVVDRVEVTITHKDGTHLQIGVSVAPLQGLKGATVGRVYAFRDLTPIRRMEEAMRRSEHLAGIGRLAASVAHELRNPLASISGSMELLRGSEHFAPAQEEQQLMDIVQREIARLGALVDGLLQYARPQPPQRVPMDMGDLVQDVAKMLREEVQKKGLTVHTEVALGIRLEADPSQMRQVLWNLLRNAVEASPSGGTIDVQLRQVDSQIAISVHDSGAGLSAEAGQRLFEPFYTTKERGVGLGLAIARRIVEEHRGTIEVEYGGQVGCGATFIVSLPTLPLKTELGHQP